MQNQTQPSSFPRSKAFRRGLNNVRMKDYDAVTAGIMAILGVTTRPALFYYVDGKNRTLDVDKARQIEELFLSYGITEIWGKN